MPIRKRPDFKVLSIEELTNLTDYQRHKYNIQLEAYQRKKQKRDNFTKYLEESCERYK